MRHNEFKKLLKTAKEHGIHTFGELKQFLALYAASYSLSSVSK